MRLRDWTAVAGIGAWLAVGACGGGDDGGGRRDLSSAEVEVAGSVDLVLPDRWPDDDPSSDTSVEPVSDVREGDEASAPDDTFEATCVPGAGAFLCPCEGNDDCQSGYCLFHLGERVCTEACVDGCPAGWECLPAPGTDMVVVCVSRAALLCMPCREASDCAS